MKAQLLFCLIYVVTFAVDAQGQTPKVCQMVLDCIKDAEKAQQQCQSSNSQNQTKKGSKDQCGVADLQAQIKSKTLQQKQNYADCLQKRMSMEYDAISLKKGKQQQHCQDALSGNNQNSNANQSASVNTRLKRQSPQGENQNGLSNNDNAGQHGNKKHGGNGRGKGGGHKNKSPQQQCQKDAKQKFKRCKAIAECCSETTICHLEFELSPLHDEIRKLQQDVALKRHDCNAKKVQGSNSKQQPVLHDDPMSLVSDKGESMQSDSEETAFDVKSDLDKFTIDGDDDGDDM